MGTDMKRLTYWHIPLSPASSEKLILFTACDGKYLDYAIPLIRSLDVFSPGFLFVLHLVNPTQLDIDRVLRLSKHLTNTRLAFSSENAQLGELLDEAFKAYYASARFFQLPELLEHDIPVFMLDTDSLVVNPINFEFSEAGADVALFCADLYPETPEKWRVKNGAIWIQPNQNTKQLASILKTELLNAFSADMSCWYIDQIILGRKLLELREHLKIGQIRSEYIDWEFHGKSIIWTAKGDRKNTDVRYLTLMNMLSDQRPDYLGVLDQETNKKKMVGIYLPRFDMPWKAVPLKAEQLPPPLKEDTLQLRLLWKQFTTRLANALERRNVTVDVIECPSWEIRHELVDKKEFQIAFIPHRCQIDYKTGKTKTLFYMQEYFRWVFVVNECGWSAASSVYPINTESLPVTDKDCFRLYRRRLRAGKLGSKFAQPARRSKDQLLADRTIPGQQDSYGVWQPRPYIFLPLQIPHDQSIRYFSDVSEGDAVRALANWASERGIAVVIKPHPASRKLMSEFEKFSDGVNTFWSEGHVHDLISYATGVYTINSGVGFEALFHLKPVVTFGRAEYDCVSFHATSGNLDAAWDYCLQADSDALEMRYRRFVDWFLGEYAFDMSDREIFLDRLDRLAEEIAIQISSSKIEKAE